MKNNYLPMDFCKVRSRSPKNIVSTNKLIMTEVDVVTGFGNSEEDQPNITIENKPDRQIVSLGLDDNNNDDIGDIGIIEYGNTDNLFTKTIDKPPVNQVNRKPRQEIIKVGKPDKPKKIERVESFTSGSDSGGSYLEYKRDNNKSSSIPFNFGDIADPIKHKPTEEVKYDDNGYSSAGDSSGSDSGGSYRDHRNDEPSRRDSSRDSSRDNGRDSHRSSRDNGETESDRYRREDEEKQDLLIKLQALESKGNIRLSREFSMKSRVEEIRFEYEKQKSLLERDASVEFMKSLLITFVHGTEILNTKFDPVGAKLNGWSESIMENIGTYEAIFERLNEKYQGSVDIAPELELLMALASSAFMFHMMQTLFKNAAPNMGAAVMQDPNLMNGLGQAAARAADMSNQQSRGIPTPSNQSMSGPSGGFDISSLLSGLAPMMGAMGGMGGGGMQMPQMPQKPNVSQAYQNPPPRPVNPRNAEPTISGFGQQNYNRPRDDDENSRVTDMSDDSNGSGVRISSNKKGNRTIHLM